MKNKNMTIYIVIAILLIALLLWYLFTPKQKSAPATPQPQTSSVTGTPQPAAPAAVPPAPATTATAPEQQATPPAPAAPPAEPAYYTVVRGDCLWRIAAQSGVYGNPFEWPLIYKANDKKIKDADLIYPGQMLVINHHPSAAAIAVAIKHAKSRGPWSLGTVEASDKAYLAQ